MQRPGQPCSASQWWGSASRLIVTGSLPFVSDARHSGNHLGVDVGKGWSSQIGWNANTPMLTPKQARFVEEYLRDLNATKAAIRAGYSQKTANQQGPRLLEKPEIAAAIDAAKDARSERAQIDALWVLQRLVSEAEADLADLFDDNGNLLPVEAWPLIWRQGLVQGVEIEAIKVDGMEIGKVTKIKLDSRLKRVELLGRHIGVNAFQENVNHAGLDALGDRLERALKRNG